MKMTLNSIDPSDVFYHNIDGFCEADSYAYYQLWETWHGRVKTWEQEMQGRINTIGKWHDRPVCLSLNAAKINGKRVLFYDPTSQLVDWVMVEEWLSRTLRTKNQPRTDAMNFGNLLRNLKIDF